MAVTSTSNRWLSCEKARERRLPIRYKNAYTRRRGLGSLYRVGVCCSACHVARTHAQAYTRTHTHSCTLHITHTDTHAHTHTLPASAASHPCLLGRWAAEPQQAKGPAEELVARDAALPDPSPAPHCPSLRRPPWLFRASPPPLPHRQACQFLSPPPQFWRWFLGQPPLPWCTCTSKNEARPGVKMRMRGVIN